MGRPPTHVLNTRYISDGERDPSPLSLSEQYQYVKSKEHVTSLRRVDLRMLAPPSTFHHLLRRPTKELNRAPSMALRCNTWRCSHTRGKLA